MPDITSQIPAMPFNTHGSSPTLLWDESIRRILLVRLRSIGDTVLTTPCIAALRAWRPNLTIDVLLEPTSSPILHAHPEINEVLVLPRPSSQWRRACERLNFIQDLRARHYDVAINLHGGTTASLITASSGSRITVAYASSNLSFLSRVRAPQSSDIWKRHDIHAVEHMLGLLRWIGVNLPTLPGTALVTNPQAEQSLDVHLRDCSLRSVPFAVLHVASQRPAQQWQSDRYARVADYIFARYGLPIVLLAAPSEVPVLDAVTAAAHHPLQQFADLSLSETMALIRRAALFVGNDSGPAHIAAAFGVPTAVIFGYSSPVHWRPWTTGPHDYLYPSRDAAPHTPGTLCTLCGLPAPCIHDIAVERVITMIDMLSSTFAHPAQQAPTA